MNLCKYKDIFGKPNEGVHSTRIFGLAFWDIVMTIILIIFVNLFVGNIWMTTLCTVILFVTVHKLFCVDTAFNKMIGISGQTL